MDGTCDRCVRVCEWMKEEDAISQIVELNEISFYFFLRCRCRLCICFLCSRPFSSFTVICVDCPVTTLFSSLIRLFVCKWTLKWNWYCMLLRAWINVMSEWANKNFMEQFSVDVGSPIFLFSIHSIPFRLLLFNFQYVEVVHTHFLIIVRALNIISWLIWFSHSLSVLSLALGSSTIVESCKWERKRREHGICVNLLGGDACDRLHLCGTVNDVMMIEVESETEMA